jgi:hypothetical protein
VKTLTKKKKEKENVLTNLELINLNNVFMLQFEEIKRKITYVYKDIEYSRFISVILQGF